MLYYDWLIDFEGLAVEFLDSVARQRFASYFKTFSRLESGLPSQSKDIGRIGLAVSESEPNKLYVIIAKTKITG